MKLKVGMRVKHRLFNETGLVFCTKDGVRIVWESGERTLERDLLYIRRIDRSRD